MKNVLITLSGSTSVGKTTTLRGLEDKIKEIFGYTEVRYYSYSNLDLDELSSEKARNQKDKIIVIKGVSNKQLTIGINTAGDTGYIVEQSIKLFGENKHNINCDIVICPTKAGCRTDEGSIAVINKFFTEHKEKVKLIPLFKILVDPVKAKEYNQLQRDNDETMSNIIIEQLDKEMSLI